MAEFTVDSIINELTNKTELSPIFRGRDDVQQRQFLIEALKKIKSPIHFATQEERLFPLLQLLYYLKFQIKRKNNLFHTDFEKTIFKYHDEISKKIDNFNRKKYYFIANIEYSIFTLIIKPIHDQLFLILQNIINESAGNLDKQNNIDEILNDMNTLEEYNRIKFLKYIEHYFLPSLHRHSADEIKNLENSKIFEFLKENTSFQKWLERYKEFQQAILPRNLDLESKTTFSGICDILNKEIQKLYKINSGIQNDLISNKNTTEQEQKLYTETNFIKIQEAIENGNPLSLAIRQLKRDLKDYRTCKDSLWVNIYRRSTQRKEEAENIFKHLFPEKKITSKNQTLHILNQSISINVNTLYSNLQIELNKVQQEDARRHAFFKFFRPKTNLQKILENGEKSLGIYVNKQ